MVFEIFAHSHDLDLSRSRDVVDSPYAISYWCPIGTESLSSTVFEIFGRKTCVRARVTAMQCIQQTLLSGAQLNTVIKMYKNDLGLVV